MLTQMSLLFLFLFTSLQSIQGSDVISLTASNHTVPYNERVTLSCHLLLNSTLDINDTTVTFSITNPSGLLLTNYTNDDNTTAMMQTISYEIARADITDRGVYTCTVSLDDVIEGRVTFVLNITGFQLMVTPLSDISVSLNTTLHITCTFNHDMVRVAWSRYGTPLTSGGDIDIMTMGSHSWLTLTNAGFNDMGSYQCAGRLFEFTGMTQINIIINEYVPLYINTSKYELNMVQSTVSNSVNGLIVLACDVYGVPQPEYVWIKGGTDEIISNYTNDLVGPYVSNGSLIIPINSLPTNSGNYTCYGIHRLNHLVSNISLLYNITVLPAEETEPFNWYIFAIAAIIAVTLILMFAIGVYFIAANTDICINNEKRRMKRMEKKLKKQLKSQEVADDEFGFYAPDLSRTNTIWDAENISLDSDNSSTVGLVNAATEEEDIIEEEDNDSYQGTFVRKQTIPKQKKKLGSKSSLDSGKPKQSFIRPVITLPPVASDTRLAVELLPETPSEQEMVKPVQSEDSMMHYMETLYTPPPPESSSSDNSDSDNEQPKVTKISSEPTEDGRHYMETVYTPPPPPVSDSDDDDELPLINAATGITTNETSSNGPTADRPVDEPVQREDGMYFMETLYTPPPLYDEDSEDDEIPYELTNLAAAGPTNIPPISADETPLQLTHTEDETLLQLTQIDDEEQDNMSSHEEIPPDNDSSHYMETLYTPPPHVSSDESDDDGIPIDIQNLAKVSTPVAMETAPTPVVTETAPTPVVMETAPTLVAMETAPTLVATETVPTPVSMKTAPKTTEETEVKTEIPSVLSDSPQTTPLTKNKVPSPAKKLSPANERPSSSAKEVPSPAKEVSKKEAPSPAKEEPSLEADLPTTKKEEPPLKKQQPKPMKKKAPVIFEPPSEPVKNKDGTVYMETVYIPPPDIFTDDDDDDEDDETYQEQLAKNMTPKTTTLPESKASSQQETNLPYPSAKQLETKAASEEKKNLVTTTKRSIKEKLELPLQLKSDDHKINSGQSVTEDFLRRSSVSNSRRRSATGDSLKRPSASDSRRKSATEDSLKRLSASDSHRKSATEDTLERPSAVDPRRKSYFGDSLKRPSASDPHRKSATEDSLKRPSASDPRRKSYSGDSLKRPSAADKKTKETKTMLSVDDSVVERRKSWDISLGRKKKGEEEKEMIKEAKKSEKAFKKSKKSTTSSFATVDVIY